jgi:hypothetical protein
MTFEKTSTNKVGERRCGARRAGKTRTPRDVENFKIEARAGRRISVRTDHAA